MPEEAFAMMVRDVQLKQDQKEKITKLKRRLFSQHSGRTVRTGRAVRGSVSNRLICRKCCCIQNIQEYIQNIYKYTQIYTNIYKMYTKIYIQDIDRYIQNRQRQ